MNKHGFHSKRPCNSARMLTPGSTKTCEHVARRVVSLGLCQGADGFTHGLVGHLNETNGHFLNGHWGFARAIGLAGRELIDLKQLKELKFVLNHVCCVPMCQPEPMCQPGCFEPICQPNRANVSTLNQYVNLAVPIRQPVLI